MSKKVQQSGPFVGWMLASLATVGLSLAVLGGRLGAAPGDEAAAKWKTLEAEILPAFKERAPLRDRSSKVRGMLANPPAVPYAGNEAEFEEYFVKYVFPTWTLTDEAHLGSLAKDRDRFLTVELAKSTGPAHDKLLELTLAHATRIAQDPDFHPAVRYNAILVLGGLNAREASRGPPPTNPEPLPTALPPLRALFENPDESDTVRVAALLGILRHLEWDDFRTATPKLAADVKTPLVQQLIALSQQTDPPAGRSAEGHTWMRRRALEGLMYVSQAGPTLEISDVISKLMSSDAEPLPLRCTAADIMGRLDYKDPVVPATDISGKQLGLLALASCQAELTRLENYEKLAAMRTKLPTQYGSGMAGGGGGDMAGMMMGGMGGGSGPPPGMQGPNMGGPPSMDMSKMMEGMMPAKGKKGKTKTKSTGPPNLATPAPGGMPGYGAPKADDKNYRIDFIRRRLRSWLYAVQMGLGDAKANPANEIVRTGGTGKNATFVAKYNRGVAKHAKTDDQKTEIGEIITRVQNLVAVVETPDMTHETFVEELSAKMKELEQITGPLPSTAPPPAAEGSAAPATAAAPAIPDAAGAIPAAAKAPAPTGAKSPPAAAPAVDPVEAIPAAAPPPAGSPAAKSP